jgi:hypothetical protein
LVQEAQVHPTLVEGLVIIHTTLVFQACKSYGAKEASTEISKECLRGQAVCGKAQCKANQDKARQIKSRQVKASSPDMMAHGSMIVKPKLQET